MLIMRSINQLLREVHSCPPGTADLSEVMPKLISDSMAMLARSEPSELDSAVLTLKAAIHSLVVLSGKTSDIRFQIDLFWLCGKLDMLVSLMIETSNRAMIRLANGI